MKLYVKRALIVVAIMIAMFALMVVGASAAGDSDATNGVASITTGEDTQYYSTLQKAIDDAAEGATINVLKQINISANTSLTSSKNVTITYVGTATSPLFIVNDDYNLTISASDGKVIDFQLDAGALMRLKSSAVLNKGGNMTPVITLTNVKATSSYYLIVSNRGLRANPTINITGGEYDSGSKCIIDTWVQESNGAEGSNGDGDHTIQLVLNLTSVKLGSSLIRSRDSNLTAKFTNVIVDDTDGILIEQYNTPLYNVTIEGGVYNVKSLFRCVDSGPFVITASNAVFCSNGYASGLINNVKAGAMEVSFTNCKLYQKTASYPVIAASTEKANEKTFVLNIDESTVFGCATINTDGNVTGEVTDLTNFFKFATGSYAIKLGGTWSDNEALLADAVAMGIVAKVGDVCYSNATTAENDAGTTARKETVTVGETSFVNYYTTKIVSEGKTTYYFDLNDALDDAKEDDVITVFANQALANQMYITKPVTIVAEGDCTVYYNIGSNSPLFIVEGSNQLNVTGVKFKLGASPLIRFDNDTSTATVPEINLTDVDVDTTGDVIIIAYRTTVNPIINITRGTYTASGKYLIHTYYDTTTNPSGAKKPVITLNDVIIKAGVINERLCNPLNLTLNNCTVTTGNVQAFALYNSSYTFNVTINGGTYDSGTSYMVYACDSGIVKFTATNASFTSNYGYVFNMRRGSNGSVWNFVDCTITNSKSGGAIFAPAHSDVTTVVHTLNISNCTMSASKYFYTIKAGATLKLDGTWSENYAMLSDAVAAGIVAKVGDVYHSNATAAQTAAGEAVANTVTIDGKTLTYYTAEAVESDVVAMQFGALAFLDDGTTTTYYYDTAAAATAAESAGLEGVTVNYTGAEVSYYSEIALEKEELATMLGATTKIVTDESTVYYPLNVALGVAGADDTVIIITDITQADKIVITGIVNVTADGSYTITYTGTGSLFLLKDGSEFSISGQAADAKLVFELGAAHLFEVETSKSATFRATNISCTTTGNLFKNLGSKDDKSDLIVRFENVDANVVSVFDDASRNGNLDMIWNGGEIHSSEGSYGVFQSAGDGVPAKIKLKLVGITLVHTGSGQVIRVSSTSEWDIAIIGGTYTAPRYLFYIIDAATELNSLLIDGATMTTTGNFHLMILKGMKADDYGPIVIKNSTLTDSGASSSVIRFDNGGSNKNVDMDLTIYNSTLSSGIACISSAGSGNDSKAYATIVDSTLTSTSAGAIDLSVDEGVFNIYNSDFNVAAEAIPVNLIGATAIIHPETSATIDDIVVDEDNNFIIGTKTVDIVKTALEVNDVAITDESVAASGFVAKIGDASVHYYNTLQQAINDAEIEETIVVIKQIVIDSETNITSDKSVTVTYGGAGSIFLLNEGANLNIDAGDGDNYITFNPGTANFIYISETTAPVIIVLKNVNVTANNHLISCDTTAKIKYELEIVRGTYSAPGKYMVYTGSSNALRNVTKFHITDAKLNIALISSRGTKLSNAVLTNVYLYNPGGTLLLPYSSNGYTWDIRIVGGVYNLGNYGVVYSPDSNTVNITAENAIFASNHTTSNSIYYLQFYNAKGNLNLSFTNCKLLEANPKNHILYTASANTATLSLDLTNTEYGCGTVTVAEDGTVTVSEITDTLNGFLRFGTSSNAKLKGNFVNDKKLLAEIIAAGVTSKVNDWYYLKADVAATDGASLTKNTVIVDSKEYNYYADTTFSHYNVACTFGITDVVARVGNVCYRSFDDAMTSAVAGATIYVMQDTTQREMKGSDSTRWDKSLTITSDVGGPYTVTTSASYAAFNLGNDVVLRFENIKYDLTTRFARIDSNCTVIFGEGAEITCSNTIFIYMNNNLAADSIVNFTIDKGATVNWTHATTTNGLIYTSSNKTNTLNVTIRGNVNITSPNALAANYETKSKGILVYDKTNGAITGGKEIPFSVITDPFRELYLKGFATVEEADALAKALGACIRVTGVGMDTSNGTLYTGFNNQMLGSGYDNSTYEKLNGKDGTYTFIGNVTKMYGTLKMNAGNVVTFTTTNGSTFGTQDTAQRVRIQNGTDLILDGITVNDPGIAFALESGTEENHNLLKLINGAKIQMTVGKGNASSNNMLIYFSTDATYSDLFVGEGCEISMTGAATTAAYLIRIDKNWKGTITVNGKLSADLTNAEATSYDAYLIYIDNSNTSIVSNSIMVNSATAELTMNAESGTIRNAYVVYVKGNHGTVYVANGATVTNSHTANAIVSSDSNITESTVSGGKYYYIGISDISGVEGDRVTIDSGYVFIYDDTQYVTWGGYDSSAQTAVTKEYKGHTYRMADELAAIFGATIANDTSSATKKVLVGLMDATRTKMQSMNLDVNEYAIVVENGQVMLLAWSDAALTECVKQFKAIIGMCSDGSSVRLPKNYSATLGCHSEWKVDFSRPLNTTLYAAQDVNDNSVQLLYTGNGATKSNYTTYVGTLLNEGYTVVWGNDIGENTFALLKNDTTGTALYVAYNDFTYEEKYAGTDGAGGLFHTEETTNLKNSALGGYYSGNFDDTHVHTNYIKCIRIVSSPLDSIDLPGDDLINGKDYEKVTDTKMVILPFGASGVGMGYVIMLEDGSFLIVDGGDNKSSSTGVEGEANANGLTYADATWKVISTMYEDLYGKAPSAENKVHISAWYLTHSHRDHFKATEAMLNKYGSMIQMDYMIANLPGSGSFYAGYDASWGMNKSYITTLQNAVGGFDFIKVHTGQVVKLVNLDLEVLMTFEDHLPFAPMSSNDTCTIVRAYFNNSDALPGVDAPTIMFLADAWRRESRNLCVMYDSYLKSDIVQLAHHGNVGSERILYATIDADTVLFPHYFSSYESYTTWLTIGTHNNTPDRAYAYVADKFAVKNANYVLCAPFDNDANDAGGDYNVLVFKPQRPDYENIYDLFTGTKISYSSSNGSTYINRGQNNNVISVNIYWGDLSFTYNHGSEGVWDPEDLVYDYPENGIEAGWVANGDALISVENAGYKNVTFTISYAAASGYSNISGEFTDVATSTKVNTSNAITLNVFDRKNYKLGLVSTLLPTVNLDNAVVGTITVTLN